MSNELGPFMTPEEVYIISALIEEYQPASVCEWGTGHSTVYWPPKHDCVQTWISIEHDEAWANKLENSLDLKVYLLLIPFPGYWDYLRHSGPFDFILIDGRHRVECAKVATTILAPNGIALLHDSARERYQPIWGFFEYARTLTEGREAGQGLTMFWN